MYKQITKPYKTIPNYQDTKIKEVQHSSAIRKAKAALRTMKRSNLDQLI